MVCLVAKHFLDLDYFERIFLWHGMDLISQMCLPRKVAHL